MARIYIYILGVFLLVDIGESQAQTPQYTKGDSLKIVSLLAEAAKTDKTTNWVLFFSKHLEGIPYVAKTLEKNDKERLVINLSQLDCTTFVETVMALSLCAKNKQTRFDDYCRFLRMLRYRGGMVSYPTRLHYFTSWIADNTTLGFVSEVQQPDTIFTQIQTLAIDYMSQHVESYPMLVKNPSWVKEVSDIEKTLNGKKYRFIPKGEITNTKAFRQIIHDGDIIAIVTNKKGLDTSHIGFAVWRKDGLHLINASQIHKKVVNEPMTLYEYMQKHPTQIGIRIIRTL